MDSVKSNKRFSFAGFSSGLSRSLSFSNNASKVTTTTKDVSITPQQKGEEEEELRRTKRAQKSKSLYIKSFSKKVSAPETTTLSKYDASEATQSNGKEIRNSIRRSLSAVLYASPHVTDDDDKKSYSNKLVPVLVTPGLSESVGGILIDDGTKNKIKQNADEKNQESLKKSKKKPVEYDNSLEVISKKDTTTIIWQGYGYIIKNDEQEEVASEMKGDLHERFEKEIWKSYCGLIHPLHLFQDDDQDVIINRGRWTGLSVTELRRYYDNYGSMMLKIREARMIEQQKNYQCLDHVKKEWIIPDIEEKTKVVVA